MELESKNKTIVNSFVSDVSSSCTSTILYVSPQTKESLEQTMGRSGAERTLQNLTCDAESDKLIIVGKDDIKAANSKDIEEKGLQKATSDNFKDFIGQFGNAIPEELYNQGDYAVSVRISSGQENATGRADSVINSQGIKETIGLIALPDLNETPAQQLSEKTEGCVPPDEINVPERVSKTDVINNTLNHEIRHVNEDAKNGRDQSVKLNDMLVERIRQETLADAYSINRANSDTEIALAEAELQARAIGGVCANSGIYGTNAGITITKEGAEVTADPEEQLKSIKSAQGKIHSKVMDDNDLKSRHPAVGFAYKDPVDFVYNNPKELYITVKGMNKEGSFSGDYIEQKYIDDFEKAAKELAPKYFGIEKDESPAPEEIEIDNIPVEPYVPSGDRLSLEENPGEVPSYEYRVEDPPVLETKEPAAPSEQVEEPSPPPPSQDSSPGMGM